MGDSAQRLRYLRTLNRGAEVYLAQMMRVSATAWREGMGAFGAVTPQQVVMCRTGISLCSPPPIR